MASVSGSGGKIIRPRLVTRTTPYDRPRVQNSDPENPNWISKFIFSPSRKIAAGAGKLISSVFSPSSSSSSSGIDLSSEDESDDEDNNAEISSLATSRFQERNRPSEVLKGSSKETQQAKDKRNTKHLIEQLLMQEIFSREECDRLTNIIRSRVLDGPICEETRQVDHDKAMDDVSSKAVMEAKKWLEEKKLGSSSKPELEHRTGTSASILPNVKVNQGETSSPVDIAKSFMQERPLWASPSMNHTGYTSSPPTGEQLFKEDTLFVGGNSFSSSKMKRDSNVSGSWNIQEEIRRVRLKATKDLLESLPSTKMDWSEVALGSKNNLTSYEKLDADLGADVQNPKKSIDASLNMTEGVSSSHDVQVLQKRQYDLCDEALPHNPTTPVPEQNQEVDTSQSFKEIRDPELHDRGCLMSKEAAEIRDAIPANDITSLLSSEHNHRKYNEQHNGSIQDEADAPSEACELCEASVEVPATSEQDIVASGSQNSSHGHYEGREPDLSQPDTKSSSPGNTGGLGRPQRSKMTRSTRRGRGRGKRH